MQLKEKEYELKVAMFPIVAKPNEIKLENDLDIEEDYIEEDIELLEQTQEETEKPNFFQQLILKIKNIFKKKEKPEPTEIELLEDFDDEVENFEETEEFEEEPIEDSEEDENIELEEDAISFNLPSEEKEEEEEDKYMPTDYGLDDILTTEELAALVEDDEEELEF